MSGDSRSRDGNPGPWFKDLEPSGANRGRDPATGRELRKPGSVAQ